jgi:hypothetical protein
MPKINKILLLIGLILVFWASQAYITPKIIADALAAVPRSVVSQFGPSVHTAGTPFSGGQSWYAECQVFDGSISVPITTQNVWVDVDACTASSTRGWSESSGVLTADADSLIGGRYKVHYSISYMDGKDKTFQAGVKVNGVLVDGCGSQDMIDSTVDTGILVGVCSADISPSDDVKIVMRGTNLVVSAPTVVFFSAIIHKI